MLPRTWVGAQLRRVAGENLSRIGPELLQHLLHEVGQRHRGFSVTAIHQVGTDPGRSQLDNLYRGVAELEALRKNIRMKRCLRGGIDRRDGHWYEPQHGR